MPWSQEDMGSVETADRSESMYKEVSGTVRGLIFRIWTCAELWLGFIAVLLRASRAEWTAVMCLDLVHLVCRGLCYESWFYKLWLLLKSQVPFTCWL